MSSLEFWRLGRWHSSPFSGRSWGKKREREGKEGYFCSVGAHQVFGGQRGGLRVLGGRGTLHQTHLHLQNDLVWLQALQSHWRGGDGFAFFLASLSTRVVLLTLLHPPGCNIHFQAQPRLLL